MAKARDIKIEDNDLVIKNGDFVISNSDQQHVEDLIKSYTGHYKEFPLIGVGVDRFINSSGKDQEIKRLIKLQLEADGYKVNKIVKINDEYYIDAVRI